MQCRLQRGERPLPDRDKGACHTEGRGGPTHLPAGPQRGHCRIRAGQERNRTRAFRQRAGAGAADAAPHGQDHQGQVSREEIRNAGLYGALLRAFAVLLPIRSVGAMRDARSYDLICALRAWPRPTARPPTTSRSRTSFSAAPPTRIINEVRGINCLRALLLPARAVAVLEHTVNHTPQHNYSRSPQRLLPWHVRLDQCPLQPTFCVPRAS